MYFPIQYGNTRRHRGGPIEGLYTVLSFEIFGLNRVLFTLSALLLSAGSCLLMGACLNRAFPGRKTLVVLAVFFGFLLTPLSNLIYMFHTDNSRLSMLLFWTSVLAFQHWAGGSKSWLGLTLPVILYLAASLTYENATFLIFAVPLFVWPIHVSRGQSVSDRSFALRLGVGITVAFAVFVFVRFGLFGGGAVGHRSLVPSFNLVSSYVYNLMLYTVAPLREISWDPAAWVWACPVALLAAALVFRASRDDSAVSERPAGLDAKPHVRCRAGHGGSGFGNAPVPTCRIQPCDGLHEPKPRVLVRDFRNCNSFSSFVLSVKKQANSFWDKSHRGRHDRSHGRVPCGSAHWVAGGRGQREKSLLASLLKQVPDVKPGTTFLLMDVQSYVSKGGMDRAVVFQGVDGIGEFVKMLYG